MIYKNTKKRKRITKKKNHIYFIIKKYDRKSNIIKIT